VRESLEVVFDGSNRPSDPALYEANLPLGKLHAVLTGNRFDQSRHVLLFRIGDSKPASWPEPTLDVLIESKGLNVAIRKKDKPGSSNAQPLHKGDEWP
jgi:hypothetical protein